MCLNKKVVAGAVIAAVLVLVVAPGVAGAAFPLLILAICPLSMILMARGMGRFGASQPSERSRQDEELDELRREVARLRSAELPAESSHSDRIQGSSPPVDAAGHRTRA